MKNFLGTFTLFYTFDFVKDKASWMWRVNNKLHRLEICPIFPVKWVLPPSVLIWPVHLLILGQSCLEKWLNFGLKRKEECALSKETTEKLWLGFGVIICLLKDHEFSSNYYPGFLRNYFFYQFPWMFTTLMLADSMGIFSYCK